MFILAATILWVMLAYPSPSRVSRFGLGLALGFAIQEMLAALFAATVEVTPRSAWQWLPSTENAAYAPRSQHTCLR